MVIYPNKYIMEVKVALLTVTDTRTIENDKSGEILVKNKQLLGNKLDGILSKAQKSSEKILNYIEN